LKRMKRKILSAAVAAITFGMIASASRADTADGTVVLTLPTVGQFGVGGEFTAQMSGPAHAGTSDANVYIATQSLPAQGSAGGTTFQTFCIEAGSHDEDFNPGVTYNAYIVSQPPSTSPPLSFMKLNAVTSNLFGAFWNGDLASAQMNGYSGYDYSNSSVGGASRTASAAELQFAIWVAQGDAGIIYGSSSTPPGLGDSTDYDSQVGILEADYGTYLTSSQLTQSYDLYQLGLGATYALDGTNVAVLGLGDPEGYYQAQLVVTTTAGMQAVLGDSPLPKSGLSGFCLLGGLAGFQGLRKLQRSKRRLV
jgi:hypothetical protein